MSNLPPNGPPPGAPNPAEPPVGPPSGPPAGPPTVPAPEFLDSGSGGPALPARGGAGGGAGGSGRKKWLIGGGAVVGLAAVGAGGYFAWSAYFATGPQPAEALPDSTVGYVSVDLDPSGKQKIEALKTLKKFPAFNDNVNLNSDDDLREKFFNMLQDSEGVCPDISFEDDIDPWLGDRFGFAGVDLDGGDATEGVVGVGVVQLDDADKAEEGLKKLRECLVVGGSSSATPDDEYDSTPDSDSGTTNADQAALVDEGESADAFGWSVQGDWVVLAETDDIAKQVTDAAKENPLSDDYDYQKWTEAAGDPGILTAYAAPEAGPLLALAAEDAGSLGSDLACGLEGSATPVEPADPAPTSPYPTPDSPESSGYPDYPDYSEDPCDALPPSTPSTDALADLLKDFDGAALTVRFDDGGVEVESVSSVDYLGLEKLYDNDHGDDVVSTLPDDTAIALGVGFESGWAQQLLDFVKKNSGAGADLDQALQQLEDESGLSLPEDLETLTGESLAVALGGDFDPASIEGMDGTDTGSLPIGVKIKGDPDKITEIIDRLLADADLPADAKDQVNYKVDGDYVVVSFSPEYAEQLLDGGKLGDTDAYQSVIEDSGDANGVFFVNFNADWLQSLAEEDPEAKANLDPLSAVGMTGWVDDGIVHSLLKVTTD